MCSSGDQTAKQSEQVQAGFQQQLVQIFQEQYAEQKGLLDFAKPYLKSMVTNPTGFTAGGEAALRTQASDTIAQQTQNVKQAANATQFARGGDALPSGVSAQISAGIDTAGATADSQAQIGISEENEALKLQNYWRAIGALSNQAELEAPQSYAGAATSAGNSVANLSQAVLASQQAGWANFGGILSGIGGLATGAGAIGTGFKLG